MDWIQKLAKRHAKLIKFLLSSGVSFLVDISAYALLLRLTAGLAQSLIISNITARIISSTVNYTINRNIVFGHSDSVLKSAVRYYLLAAGILLANTLLLSFLVHSLQVPKIPAKLLVEITLFTISWLVQRFVIFNTDK